MIEWRIGGMRSGMENQSIRKNLPLATFFFATDPTRTALGLNLGIADGKPELMAQSFLRVGASAKIRFEYLAQLLLEFEDGTI
jgi:hypothetical protein